MMEFIIVSGIVTTVVLRINEVHLNKRLGKLGYVKKGKKSNSLLVTTVGLLSKFIPIVNLGLAFSVTFSNLYMNDEKFIEIVSKNSSIYKPTDLKEMIDCERSKLENICDDMKMVGSTELEMKREVAAIQDSIKDKQYSEYILDDLKYKKLEAMSDTELWLRDIEMEVGLSTKEKKKLLSSYIDDFKNVDSNAKPKAIEKTLKLVNNRK